MEYLWAMLVVGVVLGFTAGWYVHDAMRGVPPVSPSDLPNFERKWSTSARSKQPLSGWSTDEMLNDYPESIVGTTKSESAPTRTRPRSQSPNYVGGTEHE